MTNVRNILLIGRSGNGKSALANVLLNKNGNFEEVFKESDDATSETRDIQIEELEIDNIKYKIIDTVGIGDTKLSLDQILGKLIYKDSDIKESGINQILFVTSGRFTEEEKKTYNLLKEAIFNKEAFDYT